MADVVRVHAPDLTQTASVVAQRITDAARPATTATPLATVASPVDAAATSAARAIQTKMAGMSSELAPRGPAMQQAGVGSAAALTAQDLANAVRLPSVPTPPSPPQASVPQIRALDNHTWKTDPPPPAPPPAPLPSAGDPPAEAAQRYSQTQLTRDEQIVHDAEKSGRNSYLPSMEGKPGFMTREESDAADRVRDYQAIMNPATSADARKLAGERLDDYNKSKIVGPLPRDTVLGADARTRAEARLKLQHDLENGNTSLDVPKFMAPDDATRMVDGMEATDRANVLTRLQQTLQAGGMSPEGAAQVAEGYAHGVIPPQYLAALEAAGKPFDAGKDALKDASDLLHTGQHWVPKVNAFTPADIEFLHKAAGFIGWPGNAITLGTGVYEWLGEGRSPLEIAAKTAGGAAGVWGGIEGGGSLGALFGGPPGAFLVALALGTIGGLFGDAMGGRAYEWLAH